MVTQGVRRIVCVDDTDNVSGIVSLSDIFRFIVGSISPLGGQPMATEPAGEAQ